LEGRSVLHRHSANELSDEPGSVHFFQNELVRVLIACLAASGLPSNCLLSSALRRRRYLATDRGMRLRIPLSDLDFIDNLFDTLNARLDGIRQTGETRSRSSGHENQPDESYRFIHPAPASPAGRGGVGWEAHPTVSNQIWAAQVGGGVHTWDSSASS
jgi:hypothetical protein